MEQLIDNSSSMASLIDDAMASSMDNAMEGPINSVDHPVEDVLLLCGERGE